MSDKTNKAMPTLDEFLCFAVWSAGLALNRAYKPLLKRFGLTYSQYLLLIALAARDGQTVSELGQQMFLESNTLTPLIKRLEGAGLLSRSRDERDERVVRVSLSEKGRSLAEDAAQCLPDEIMRESGLTLPEMSELRDRVSGLRDHLMELAEPDRFNNKVDAKAV